MSKPMTPQARTRSIRMLPARSMDVSLEADAVHQFVFATMARHQFSAHAEVVGGVALYRFSSPGKDFLFDFLEIDIFRTLAGVPRGWAEAAAWTVPVPGGVRLTISLVTGYPHAKTVSAMGAELITEFGAHGSLMQASEPFTGLDLPPDSPGRPKYHRKEKRGHPS